MSAGLAAAAVGIVALAGSTENIRTGSHKRSDGVMRLTLLVLPYWPY